MKKILLFRLFIPNLKLSKNFLLFIAFNVAIFSNSQTTVIYSFSDSGAQSGFNVADPGVMLDANIGFGSFKNSGTSNPGIFSSQLRLYQNATKGGSIIIYANNGVTITNIIVNASSRTGDAGYIVDGGVQVNMSGGSTYTISGVNGVSEVEFFQREGGSSNRIYIDSFEVTYTSSSVNAAPFISNINAIPSSPSSTDVVVVTADITDADGIASVMLNYGTASGNLTNSITMSNTSGDEYTATIPAQADSTVVYYDIEATDNNANPETATSVELNYTVMDPQPQGLQIAAVDTKYTVDFDNTVSNVNNGAFSGTGFTQMPSSGQLDSDAFLVTGMSSGDTNFGDTETSGDYAKGTSAGGESTGGIYAFEVGTGDYALGFQASSSDFTPGTIQLRVQNATGATITDLSLSYDLFHYNNEGRLGLINFNHGEEGTSLVAVSDFDNNIDDSDDGSPTWLKNGYSLDLSGLDIQQNETYILEWEYDSPGGSGSNDEFAIDNIQVIANSMSVKTSFDGNYESLIVNGDVNLVSKVELKETLSLNTGNLNTNDNLVFKSSAGKSAVLNEVTSGTITGNVTIEQYYEAQRAFRFVSSPVDMSGTVYSDWQQDGLNVGDTGYESGVGTQITGGTTASGFDQSTSNNPSMFGFSNDVNQDWLAVTATNSLTLSAGDAYRLMIRGSRDLDLSSATATATTTLLESNGSLKTGDVVNNYAASLTTGTYIFVGNPYQSRVDVDAVLQDASTEDINTGFGYVWNPLAGTAGAYRLYDYSTDTTTPADAAVDGVLQPSQSMFLQIDNDGDGDAPSLTFKESAKVSGSTMLSTFSTPQSTLQLDVYQDVMTPALDGVRALFSTNGNDGVDSSDATKLGNPSENIALLNGSSYLILENRSLPQNGTVLPLYTWGFTTGDYVFNLNVNGLNTGLNAYLHDALTGEYTDINTGSLLSKSISFDESNTASMDALRFSIVFSNTTLSVFDELATSSISVYPNPVVSDDLTVSGLETGKTSVTLYALSGQAIFNREYDVTTRALTVEGVKGLNNGIYLLQVTQGKHSNTVKVVVNK